MSSRHVAVVLFPGVLTLDVTGPYEVLTGANTALGRSAYDITTPFGSSPTEQPTRFGPTTTTITSGATT